MWLTELSPVSQGGSPDLCIDASGSEIPCPAGLPLCTFGAEVTMGGGLSCVTNDPSLLGSRESAPLLQSQSPTAPCALGQSQRVAGKQVAGTTGVRSGRTTPGHGTGQGWHGANDEDLGSLCRGGCAVNRLGSPVDRRIWVSGSEASEEAVV